MARMNVRTRPITLSVLLAVLVASSLDARTPAEENTPLVVSWSNAGILIQGHKIRTTLPGGAVVEGKVLSAGADSLDLDVSGTSDKSIQPEGKVIVSKASLHRLTLLKPQKKWRIILTSAGAGIGLVLGGVSTYAYNEGAGGAPISLGAAMAIGGTAGYLGGWALDRNHDVTITIP